MKLSNGVIGYAYEAALHCPDCAMKRFPLINTGFPYHDRECNEVHPLFIWDESSDSGDYCDECRTDLRA